MNHSAQAVPVVERRQAASWRRPWFWQGIVLTILIGWLYAPILSRLSAQWWHDPNFSHGVFVPLFSLFVIWRERERLANLKSTPNAWGLAVVFLALLVLVLGVLGAELFLSRFSLLLLIAGLITFLAGGAVWRALLFPWAVLILMIPLPNIVFNQVTFPLQLLASRMSALLLPLAGVPVLREGNVINLPAMPLEVAQACSGIRSLLTLLTLSVIYGYFMQARITVRVVLMLASIPIAVAANSLRIIGTGLLVQYWDPDKAQGFFHIFSGWIIFVVSLAMLFLFHQLITIGQRRDTEERS